MSALDSQYIISVLVGFFVAILATLLMILISSSGYLFINLLKKQKVKPLIRSNFVVKLAIFTFFLVRLILRVLLPHFSSIAVPLHTTILTSYIVEPLAFFFLSLLFIDLKNRIWPRTQINQQNQIKRVCPKCNQDYEEGTVFCAYCGHKIENDGIREKDSRKSLKKSVLVFVLIFIVLSILFGYINYIYQERKRLKELETAELNRISKAKNNQTLYWDLSFNSPNGDGTYSVLSEDNISCFLVGVKADKRYNTYYSISDSIDNGVFTFRGEL